MIKTSSRRFISLEIGTGVRMSIPDADRTRGSSQSLLAAIKYNENGKYISRSDALPRSTQRTLSAMKG